MDRDFDIDLPEPHEGGQIEILEALEKKQFVTLLCGRRYGKSTIAIMYLLTACIQGERVGYIVPTFDLAREFLDEIKALNIPDEIIEYNNSLYTIRFPYSGGKMTFHTAENFNTLRGKKFHKIVVDEASVIPKLKDNWIKVILPTLLDYKGKALICGTPKGKDYFFELCQRDNENWQNFHRTSYDNPYNSREFLALLKEEMGEDYRQEMLAIAGENVNAIVTQEVIERNTINDYSTKPTVIIGCDIASKKDFTSIIGLDEDGSITFHLHFQKDWLTTMGILKGLDEKILKVIDRTGVGALAYELLINDYQKQNWIGFQFDSVSKPKLMQKLKHSLEKNELKFDDIVAKELSTFEVSINQQTKKMKYEAMSGQNDDTVCALAMANKYLNDAKMVNNDNPLAKYGW